MGMSENHSKERKLWWSKVSIEDKRAIGQKMAFARWSKTSIEDRRKYAMKMVQARKV